jgi:hypothetical protein
MLVDLFRGAEIVIMPFFSTAWQLGAQEFEAVDFVDPETRLELEVLKGCELGVWKRLVETSEPEWARSGIGVVLEGGEDIGKLFLA